MRELDQRGQFYSGNTVGSVGTVQGKNLAKIVDFRRKNAKFSGDLIRSGEISLDLDEISLDLLDKSSKYEILLLASENLKLESRNLRPEFGNFYRNLEIFC